MTNKKYTKCTECSYVMSDDSTECPRCGKSCINVNEEKNNSSNEVIFNILD